MSQYKPNDFAASHPFPPYNGYFPAQYLIDLNDVFEGMKDTNSLWVKRIYYAYFEKILSLGRRFFHRNNDQIEIFKKIGISLRKLKDGRNLIEKNRALFFQIFIFLRADSRYYEEGKLENLEEVFGLKKEYFESKK